VKIWNLSVKRGDDGSKHLDIQMHGVIDGGWGDEGIDTADVISELQQHRDAKTVKVRINSVGGAAFGGVAMYNALQDHPGAVTCCVEGLAASAASLVAMAGKTVMGKGSMMMIHSPSTLAMGNAAELRKTADVLDKVQDALAEIYQAKTGKSLAEINDLLDDETWMTAAEACAAGFADEVDDEAFKGAPGSAEGADEPDPSEPPEDDADDDDEADDQPQMTADGMAWRGVTFPLAALPQQILAMAKPAPASVHPPAAPAPVLAIVPPPTPPAPLSRAEIELRAPELIKALREEGHAAGAVAERARLQAIDELGLKGCAEMIAEAKYGDKPMDAPALAVAAIKAGHQAGAELLAARRVESRVLAGVVAGAPDQAAAAASARIVQAITDGGNARRGGK
jgi:ATP-dependent Clp protease, protease subunit